MFAEPRKAATIAMVRGDSTAFEVLLMKRGSNDRFLPCYYVFPGGAVEPGDMYPGNFPGDIYPHVTSTDERRSLFTHLTAGIRETFEESGILLAHDSNGSIPASDDAKYRTCRDRVFRGELTFYDFLDQHGLIPAFDRLYYINRWITPAYSPIRYDARFFAARCPDNQQVSHDGNELVETLWAAPREALKLHKQGRMKMVLPTSETLQFLSRFDNVNELFYTLEHDRKNSPLKSF